MGEIRDRVETVEVLVNNETGIKARFARESSYLQLRLICESIALGCIIAHEGFSDLSAQKIQKAYAADQIVNELSKLHDRFYPQPIAVGKRESTRMTVSDNDIEHLTKDELKNVYRKCGQVLHRGTPHSIRNNEIIEKEWIDYIVQKTQLAVNLLTTHALVMRGDQRAIMCNFSSTQVWAASAI